LFASLGLQEQWKKEKIRVSYTIDDVIFDIDFYDGIPPLLEIE
jgi:adenylate cyclase class IV